MCFERAAIIEGGIGVASGFCGGKGGNFVLPLCERVVHFGEQMDCELRVEKALMAILSVERDVEEYEDE